MYILTKNREHFRTHSKLRNIIQIFHVIRWKIVADKKLKKHWKYEISNFFEINNWYFNLILYGLMIGFGDRIITGFNTRDFGQSIECLIYCSKWLHVLNDVSHPTTFSSRDMLF